MIEMWGLSFISSANMGKADLLFQQHNVDSDSMLLSLNGRTLLTVKLYLALPTRFRI